MAGALSAPGPGRLAAADAVVRADPTVTVGHGDAAERVDVIPAPRLPAGDRRPGGEGARRARAPSATSRSPSGSSLRGSGVERVQGHGWPSAALTPYRLTSGARALRAARRRRRLAPRRPGRASLRLTAPGGEGTYRVSGVARGAANQDRGQAAVFFTGRRRRHARRARRAASTRSASSPGRLAAALHERLERSRPSRCSTAPTRPTPTRATRTRATASRWSRSSARWAASPASSRCSSSPARSRSRSPSAAARPPSCGRSGRPRARSAA